MEGAHLLEELAVPFIQVFTELFILVEKAINFVAEQSPLAFHLLFGRSEQFQLLDSLLLENCDLLQLL